MKKKFLPLCLTLTMLLTGCNNGTTPETPPASSTDTTPMQSSSLPKPEAYANTLSNYTIETQSMDAYETDVMEFDLGKETYTAQSGKQMPYRLRGVIGVPKGEGPFPLILITHGSHSNLDTSKRFDTGFTYLVEKLAKNGFIAVSMDMGSAYIWKYGDVDDKEKSIYLTGRHIECLQEANDGKGQDYPAALAGKINWDKVGMLGHSRGGEALFDIALAEQANGISVQALLSLAPTMPSDIEAKDWPTGAVSILVPEYDGDVVSLDGLGIQTMIADKDEALHTVTLLRRANHNYFNTNLTENDALLARTEDQLTDQLGAKEQQDFLAQFAADFFSASLLQKAEGTLYEAGTPMPDKMYGMDVMCRVGSAGDIVLAGAEEDTGSGSIAARNCTAAPVIDSWFYEKDEAVIDTITFGQGTYQTRRLLDIQWQEKDASLTFTPSVQDFSGHSSLSLQAVTDPASSLNAGVNSQSFTVTLTDAEGTTSSVTLPDTLNTLTKTPGELDKTPVFDVEVVFWSFPSPICSTRIPLSEFEGMDLTHIVSVSMQFDRTDSGAVYLENILLQ